MKKDIHPRMHDLSIQFGSGGKIFKTRSTNKLGNLVLTYTPLNSSLWVKNRDMTQHGRGAKFTEKYGK